MNTKSNALIELTSRLKKIEAVLKIQQLNGDEAAIAALKMASSVP